MTKIEVNMPRPQKKRYVCCEPKNDEFVPDGRSSGEKVVLTVDEYESLRLIDLEGYTQERCAEQMQVSRTTVQGVYDAARKKVADALVNGKRLLIRGGDYVTCGRYEASCGRGCHGLCHIGNEDKKIKAEDSMKVAVTYEDGKIFQHFGHTEKFKIYDISDGKISAETIVDTEGSGHGALAGFLVRHSVDTLICGGIGGGAQIALADAGIKLYGGVTGDADEAVNALLSGTLGFDPDVHCAHHDHEHADGHSCGEHGCGKHNC